MAVKRKSRSTVKSIEQQFNGSEPLVVTEENYTKTLNWYSYMYEQDEAREWLLEYAKKSGFERSRIADIRRCPKQYIPSTIGWLARIQMNGNTLTARSNSFFNEQLERVRDLGSKVQVVAPGAEKITVTIKDRTRMKAAEIIAQIESDVIDTRSSMYDFLIKNSINKVIAEYIKAFYLPVYEEVTSSDPDIQENYGNNLRAEVKYWQLVMDDLERLIANKKTTRIRKPRTGKARSAVDTVKGVLFQKESNQYKVASINPANIVGCQQLWTFNTKLRVMTRYDAIGPAGFTVSRSSLRGFDPETSISKKLRKPDHVIQSVLSGGKVQLRKLLDQINVNGKAPSGRINTDTILLKAIK